MRPVVSVTEITLCKNEDCRLNYKTKQDTKLKLSTFTRMQSDNWEKTSDK